MNSKFLALFIIFSLLVSPCASASRDVTFLNTHNVDLSRGSNNSNFITVTDNSYSETLNYTVFLDYLLHTKDVDQPNYILLNGSGSDLSQYTYTICNNYKPPIGYHNLSDNYKNIPLDSVYWSGTLFYTLNNYKLSSSILINNNDTIDLIDYVSFIQDLKDNTYNTNVPIKLDYTSFPWTKEQIEYMFSWKGPQDTFILSDNIMKVNNWINFALNTRENTLKDCMRNNEFISIINNRVAEVRGDKKDHYWSPDINGGMFENVDDEGIAYLSMTTNNIKAPLYDVQTALGRTILIIETAKQVIDNIAAAIPSDFGMDKIVKFISLGLGNLILSIKWTKFTLVDTPFSELNQQSTYLSVEKEYRNGIILNTISCCI